MHVKVEKTNMHEFDLLVYKAFKSCRSCTKALELANFVAKNISFQI